MARAKGGTQGTTALPLGVLGAGGFGLADLWVVQRKHNRSGPERVSELHFETRPAHNGVLVRLFRHMWRFYGKDSWVNRK